MIIVIIKNCIFFIWKYNKNFADTISCRINKQNHVQLDATISQNLSGTNLFAAQFNRGFGLKISNEIDRHVMLKLKLIITAWP